MRAWRIRPAQATERQHGKKATKYKPNKPPAHIEYALNAHYLIAIAMPLIDIIGYIAASLTTFSFVPQALKTFRTRDVSGISLGMYSCFTLGVALWLLYGWLLAAWPIVVANTITLSLTVGILVMKLRYRG
jgi:MtN3 and saliva related transmembrane protein